MRWLGCSDFLTISTGLRVRDANNSSGRDRVPHRRRRSVRPDALLDSYEQERRQPGAVQAGDRAPDAVVNFGEAAPRRLFELLRGIHFTCLAFDAGVAGDCAAVSRRWRGAVDLRVYDVSASPPPGCEGARGIYGIEGNETVPLIRPDGYVGFAADERAGAALDVYLRDLLQGAG
jgi:hypothetical protein